MTKTIQYLRNETLQPGAAGLLQLASALRRDEEFTKEAFHWCFALWHHDANSIKQDALLDPTSPAYGEADVLTIVQSRLAIKNNCDTMGCACGLARHLWPGQVTKGTIYGLAAALGYEVYFEGQVTPEFQKLSQLFHPRGNEGACLPDLYGVGSAMLDITPTMVADQIEKAVAEGAFG